MIIFFWIIEFLCWCTNTVSNISFFIDIDKKGESVSKNPIVLVIGGFTGEILYLPFKKYLEGQGHEVFIPFFSQEMGNLDTACSKLEKYFESKKLVHVTLIGISAGGLVSYLYLNNHNGWSRVKNFIAVGTPFKGTWMALFTVLTKAGRQLLPTSNYIKKVQRVHPKNIDRVFCIIAKKDELVPHKSSKLPGSKIIQLPIIGHVRLHAFSHKTFETIAKVARN